MAKSESRYNAGVSDFESVRETAGPVVWRPLSELDDAAVPALVHGLLCESGSLTRALRELCGADLVVRVVNERPVASKVARVREIVMSCHGTPWMFAQTVIPAATLRHNPWLAEVGARPLGERLFARADVGRSELRFGCLPPTDPLHARAVSIAAADPGRDDLWARRSDILIGGLGLTINEVFLPGLGQCR